MDWIKDLNESLEYIEEHLDEDIDVDALSEIAKCSSFHYQRMFAHMAGITLTEYIRRRKMSKAVLNLQSGKKVVDVAQKYGYDSPTAFNRAFQSVHGVPPSHAKKDGVSLIAFPPISFSFSITGDRSLNYRIENRKEFRIVGAGKELSLNVEENFMAVPKFWQENINNMPVIISCMNAEPFGVIGLTTYSDGDEFTYYIGVSSSSDTPYGLRELVVEPCTWAIFECIGPMPMAIQDLQRRIVTEWLPTSGYEYANAPDIELYFDGDQSAHDYKCEVWLPIVLK